jgi:hypothetical protein
MSIIKPNSATTPMSPVGLTPAEVREDETPQCGSEGVIDWHLDIPVPEDYVPLPKTGPNVPHYLAAKAKFTRELTELIQSGLSDKWVVYISETRLNQVWDTDESAYRSCLKDGLKAGEFTVFRVSTAPILD